MRISDTFKATAVTVGTVTSTGAVDIAISGRPFRLANTGDQTLYFHPTTTATSTNGFPLVAAATFPEKMTVSTNLSVIAGSSDTTYAVIYFDL